MIRDARGDAAVDAPARWLADQDVTGGLPLTRLAVYDASSRTLAEARKKICSGDVRVAEPGNRDTNMSLAHIRKDVQVKRIRKGMRLTGPAAAAFAQAAKQEYEGGKPIRTIAGECGRSYGTVHRALRQAGVRFRERGGRDRRNSAGAV